MTRIAWISLVVLFAALSGAGCRYGETYAYPVGYPCDPCGTYSQTGVYSAPAAGCCTPSTVTTTPAPSSYAPVPQSNSSTTQPGPRSSFRSLEPYGESVVR